MLVLTGALYAVVTDWQAPYEFPVILLTTIGQIIFTLREPGKILVGVKRRSPVAWPGWMPGRGSSTRIFERFHYFVTMIPGEWLWPDSSLRHTSC